MSKLRIIKHKTWWNKPSAEYYYSIRRDHEKQLGEIVFNSKEKRWVFNSYDFDSCRWKTTNLNLKELLIICNHIEVLEVLDKSLDELFADMGKGLNKFLKDN